MEETGSPDREKTPKHPAEKTMNDKAPEWTQTDRAAMNGAERQE